MTVKVHIAGHDGRVVRLHSVQTFEEVASGRGHAAELKSADVLETDSVGHLYGQFKAVSGSTAATTVISEPSIGGAIVLTDLVISAERKNAGLIEVRFTDNIDTITIFKGVLTDAPVNLALGFQGRWRGWMDARLEVVTNIAFVYSAASGYYKVKNGMPFRDWDSRR